MAVRSLKAEIHLHVINGESEQKIKVGLKIQFLLERFLWLPVQVDHPNIHFVHVLLSPFPAVLNKRSLTSQIRKANSRQAYAQSRK